MSPDLISQTSRPTVDGALQEALLSISPESRKKLARALLQDNALDEGVSASRGSSSIGRTSGGTRQVSSQPLIPRPPTKRRRRGYHLIEKMGLNKNKADEHMKYKRIQKEVREQSQRILDQSKTYGNQPTGLVDELKRTMLAKHPMLARFEDVWPVEDLASQYLENRAAYLKDKGEDASASEAPAPGGKKRARSQLQDDDINSDGDIARKRHHAGDTNHDVDIGNVLALDGEPASVQDTARTDTVEAVIDSHDKWPVVGQDQQPVSVLALEDTTSGADTGINKAQAINIRLTEDDFDELSELVLEQYGDDWVELVKKRHEQKRLRCWDWPCINETVDDYEDLNDLDEELAMFLMDSLLEQWKHAQRYWEIDDSLAFFFDSVEPSSIWHGRELDIIKALASAFLHIQKAEACNLINRLYNRSTDEYEVSTYSLGSRILEGKHILHQYLDVVNEYTLASPHLGAFLLSVFGYRMPEQEIINERIRPVTSCYIASLELLARTSGRSVIYSGSDGNVQRQCEHLDDILFSLEQLLRNFPIRGDLDGVIGCCTVVLERMLALSRWTSPLDCLCELLLRLAVESEGQGTTGESVMSNLLQLAEEWMQTVSIEIDKPSFPHGLSFVFLDIYGKIELLASLLPFTVTMCQRLLDYDLPCEGNVMRTINNLALKVENDIKRCWPLLCTCADRLSSRMSNPDKTDTDAMYWAAVMVEKHTSSVPLSKFLPLLIAAFTNEDYRAANHSYFKSMNGSVVSAFISILRKHPTEAEPFLHSVAERLRDVFLQETQPRTDLLYDRVFEPLQEFIREEGHTIPELRNMKELHPYMGGLPVEQPARDLAAASLLSLGGGLPSMGHVYGTHTSATLDAQEYAHPSQHAWFGY